MDKLILEQDGVVRNAETDTDSFPVEPLNTVSMVVFLFLFIYWIRKVGFKYSRYPLIVIILPMIFLGVVSSTIHHALRIDKAWNSVTILSVFYSVIMTCVYFWYRVTERWLYSFLLTLSFPVIFWMFFLDVEGVEKINLNIIFAAMSLVILIPGIINCLKNNFKNLELIGLSTFLFFLGMLFRMSDRWVGSFFSVGSHFLWHIFGGISVFVILRYIYQMDEERAFKTELRANLRREKRKIISTILENEEDVKKDRED